MLKPTAVLSYLNTGVGSGTQVVRDQILSAMCKDVLGSASKEISVSLRSTSSGVGDTVKLELQYLNPNTGDVIPDTTLNCGTFTIDNVSTIFRPDIAEITGLATNYQIGLERNRPPVTLTASLINSLGIPREPGSNNTLVTIADILRYMLRDYPSLTLNGQFPNNMPAFNEITIRGTKTDLELLNELANRFMFVFRVDNTSLYYKWLPFLHSAFPTFGISPDIIGDVRFSKTANNIYQYVVGTDGADRLYQITDNNQTNNKTLNIGKVTDGKLFVDMQSRLYQANTNQTTLDFMLAGNKNALPTQILRLEDLGVQDGDYLCTEVQHSISADRGWLTRVKTVKAYTLSQSATVQLA